MNIILLREDEISDNARVEFPRSDRRFQHIKKNLRATSGDSVKIGIINGYKGIGRLKEKGNSIELEIQSMITPPPEGLDIKLILAMQRPKTIKKILQNATAMGVKKFYIIETWKVEKSYWNSPLLSKESLSEQLQLGLEQSGDTIMPEVIIKKRLKPFVEDELPAIIADSQALIAHPYSKSPCPHKASPPLSVAVGPEGGFTDYEILKLESIGMKPVNIGKRPLRSECAVIAILAKLT